MFLSKLWLLFFLLNIIPFVNSDIVSIVAALAPLPWPDKVIRSGSPLKYIMYSLTHLTAARMSNNPTLPGRSFKWLVNQPNFNNVKKYLKQFFVPI